MNAGAVSRASPAPLHDSACTCDPLQAEDLRQLQAARAGEEEEAARVEAEVAELTAANQVGS